MSSPPGPNNPPWPDQGRPQYPGGAAQPPHRPEHLPPPLYAQYPPPYPVPHGSPQPYPVPHGSPQRARKPRNTTLLWSAGGAALALALVVTTVLLLLGNPRSGQSGPEPQQLRGGNANAGASASTAATRPNLLDKRGEELLPLMPTTEDFPRGTKVQPFVDQLGEANAEDRVKPLPAEATNPPGCWTHLEIRKNRDDIPDVTRIVTTQAKNTQDKTIAAAQLAKENNGVDALEQSKSWLGRCQEFDFVYQLKEGQPPIHFKISPLPEPPGFSDPFFGAKFTELGPQGPRGYRYFFAARVRGLLVLSEGVCDLSSCDEDQNAQIAQQIPIMFSKIVQGLRNAQ